MIVSDTIENLANYYGHDLLASDYDRMCEVCLEISHFDLDDFLFEIWKETRND